MATKHLDLEEQEQLDRLKHFWKKWGNLITWMMIAALAAYAAWSGYQYWQQRQATQAAQLYDQVEQAVQGGQIDRIERTWTDLQSQYPSTAYAQQGALMAASGFVSSKSPTKATTALTWLVSEGKDEGMVALARLRLSALALEQSNPQEALRLLQAPFPPAFEGLAFDRKGDVLSAQGQKDEALKAYRQAHSTLPQDSPYRRWVAMKLSALGVDVQASGESAAVSSIGANK